MHEQPPSFPESTPAGLAYIIGELGYAPWGIVLWKQQPPCPGSLVVGTDRAKLARYDGRRSN